MTLLSFDMSIIVLEVLAMGIKKEKEINVIHIDGGKRKILFSHMVYLLYKKF